MSQNQNLDATWQYHSGTKHSYVGLRTNPHSLDWKNKPLLFKIYPTLEVTRLPRDFRETSVPAVAAIAAAENATAKKKVQTNPDNFIGPPNCWAFCERSNCTQGGGGRQGVVSSRGAPRAALATGGYVSAPVVSARARSSIA